MGSNTSWPFIALCEGYLRIEPHFELWRFFFAVSLLKKRERGGESSVLMGCAGIHLWSQQASQYMSLQLSRSIKGWHMLWFHLKNDAAAPVPDFTIRLIEEALPV
jgi:hypothetical protein